MTLTAFLPTGAPQILPFIGTPGAATVGHALVWSETPQGFTLSPITVGPDQFSGVLPVSKGGWGTNTGSFTSPGAITLAAGGTNQSITLNASGTGTDPFGAGNIFANRTLNVVAPSNAKLFLADSNAPNGAQVGIFMDAPNANSDGYYIFNDSSGFNFFDNTRFKTCFIIAKNGNVGFGEYYGLLGSPAANFEVANSAGTVRLIQANDFTFSINQSTESTSTTTGALKIAGGIGVAKSLYAAATSGSKVNFANLPTASTGLNSGDLWRDSNGFLRIV